MATMEQQATADTKVFVGRAGGAATRICFGRTERRRAVHGGALHIFGAGQVVGYLIESDGGQRCYVVRTAPAEAVDHPLARVVGIAPEVRVLITAVGRNRCRRLVRLLKTVERLTTSSATLSDTFFLRAGVARDRYVSLEHILLGLLREEPPIAATSHATIGRRRPLPRVR